MKGLTKYQLELLKHLKAFEDAGALTDFDQHLEKLSWTPSKDSAQFVVRAVVRKGLLEKAGIQTRRGRNRVCYRLTEKGNQVFDPRPALKPEPGAEVESLEAIAMEEVASIPGLLDSPTTELLE